MAGLSFAGTPYDTQAGMPVSAATQAATKQTDDDAKMRQLQMEQQTLQNQQLMQQMSAAPGTVRFQGGPSGGSSGGGGSTSGSGDGGSNPAIAGLLASLNSQYQPAQIPITTAPNPATSAAQAGSDAAAYGQAKERGALATKAAMKGLSANLASRGVGTGTGVGASAVADLYKTGLTTLSDTDRSIAEQGATRVFENNQANADRTASQQEYNVSAQNAASQYNNDQRLRTLSLLASLY